MESNNKPNETLVVPVVKDEEQVNEDSALVYQSHEGSLIIPDEDEELVKEDSVLIHQSNNESPTKTIVAPGNIVDAAEINLDTFSAPIDDAGDRELVRHRPAAALSRDYTRTSFGANLHFDDHYTLDNMSSQLSFRDHEAIVFVNDTEHITLEKKKDDDHIVTKRTTIGSPGLLVLRMVSTWVAFMIAAFLLVFCVNTVLFLFLGLVARTGTFFYVCYSLNCINTNQNNFLMRSSFFCQLLYEFIIYELLQKGLTSSNGFNFFGFFANVLAFPVFIIGLAQIMVFAQTFVLDTWKGSKFFITVTRIDSVTIEWVSFTAFFGLPIFTGSILLITGIVGWWNITLLVWMLSVFVLYIVFMVAIIYHEVKACLDLVRLHPELRNSDRGNIGERLGVIGTWYHLCYFRLKQKLSGYEYVKFILHGREPYPENLSYDEMKKKESFQSTIGPFSSFTKLGFMQTIFNDLDEPVRQHGVHEITGQIAYVTRSSWGLESLFCRCRDTHFIAVIDGKSALTEKQVKSNVLCYKLGIFLITLAFLGVIMWLARHSLSIPLSILVAILFFVVNIAIFYRTVRSLWDTANEYKTFVMKEDGSQRSSRRTSNTIRHVHECFRVTEPKRVQYEWIGMVFIAVFFFFMPWVAIMISRNVAIAVVFIFLGFLAFLRDVCSVSAVSNVLAYLILSSLILSTSLTFYLFYDHSSA